MDRAEIVEDWFKDHEAAHSVLRDDKGNEMERLLWSHPEHWNYRVWYHAWSGLLTVCGDLGSATYLWSGNHDLRWMSQLNLGYFASKCEASEHGRRFEAWSEDVAEREIDRIAQEHADDYPSYLDDKEEKAVFDKAADRLTEELEKAGIKPAMQDQKLWKAWIRQHPQHFAKPEDWDEVYENGDLPHRLEDLVYDLVSEGTYATAVAKEHWMERFTDSGGNEALESEHMYWSWCEQNGYDVLGDDYWERGAIGMELSIRCEGHLVGLKKAFEWLDKQKEEAPAKEDVDAPEPASTPRCPRCGYTDWDARLHGDHHLCDGKLPSEQEKKPAAEETGLRIKFFADTEDGDVHGGRFIIIVPKEAKLVAVKAHRDIKYWTRKLPSDGPVSNWSGPYYMRNKDVPLEEIGLEAGVTCEFSLGGTIPIELFFSWRRDDVGTGDTEEGGQAEAGAGGAGRAAPGA